MHIYTVFTGGTIGSTVQGNVISTAGESNRLLLQMFEQSHPKNNARFTCIEPYTILSENLKAEHIVKLAATVDELLRKEDADGLIITHGSDTIRYTAALLSYLFGNAPIPILLVCSAFVLTEPRQNGSANFAAAVDFIAQKGGKGVFVSYQNQDGVCRIHRGTRLDEHKPYSADLESICAREYGRIENEKWIAASDCTAAEQDLPCLPIDPQKLILTEGSRSVQVIRPWVGMACPPLQPQAKAVLHLTNHAGTFRADEELKKLCGEALEKKIPVFLLGADPREKDYETMAAAERLGMVRLPRAAAIAQYCKLWLCAENGLDIKKYMLQRVAADHMI